MNVVTLGVHVVDVLVRPVEEIPKGQGGQLVEEIRITPAGPAGGTAVTLAKLGATVRSAGAIGQDELGDVMIELLGRFGVDASLLLRRDGVQTSASVLPIRGDGSRPAFHVVGANATYSSADAPWDAIEQADYLHLGAPEFMGGVEAAKILSRARDHGTVTSADILAPGEQAAAILDWIAPAFEHLDYLLPNEEQVLLAERRAGARAGLPGVARAGSRLRRGHPRCRRRAGRRRRWRSRRSGVPGRRRRHHRLRRRVLGRLPARARARSQPTRSGRARLCGRIAGSAGTRLGLRRLRPGGGRRAGGYRSHADGT